MPDRRIRPIEPGDVAGRRRPGLRARRVRAAAASSCHLTAEQLHGRAVRAGAGAVRAGRASTATRDRWCGYALYFLNFSTWEGVHGIYLEDLYVRPDQRGSGPRPGAADRAGRRSPTSAATPGSSGRCWTGTRRRSRFYRSLGRGSRWTAGRSSGSRGPALSANGSGNRLIQAFAGLLTSRYPVTPPNSDQRDTPAGLAARQRSARPRSAPARSAPSGTACGPSAGRGAPPIAQSASSAGEHEVVGASGPASGRPRCPRTARRSRS